MLRFAIQRSANKSGGWEVQGKVGTTKEKKHEFLPFSGENEEISRIGVQ